MILEAASFEVCPACFWHFVDPGKQVCSLLVREESRDVMYVILLRHMAMHTSAESAPGLRDFLLMG
jgi:hypothetical protein